MHSQQNIKKTNYYVSPAGKTALFRVVSNKYGEIAVAISTGEMINLNIKNSQPPSREFETSADVLILGICDTYTAFIRLHHGVFSLHTALLVNLFFILIFRPKFHNTYLEFKNAVQNINIKYFALCCGEDDIFVNILLILWVLSWPLWGNHPFFK